MSQSIRGSMWEAVVNVIVGFAVNYTANMLLLPLFGFRELNWKSNLAIGVLYTLISLVRSFLLRRAFNRMSRFEK